MSYKLTPKQSNEPMFVTWGRIRGITMNGPILRPEYDRFQALIEKFNRDLANAKIEEGYFK